MRLLSASELLGLVGKRFSRAKQFRNSIPESGIAQSHRARLNARAEMADVQATGIAGKSSNAIASSRTAP